MLSVKHSAAARRNVRRAIAASQVSPKMLVARRRQAEHLHTLPKSKKFLVFARRNGKLLGNLPKGPMTRKQLEARIASGKKTGPINGLMGLAAAQKAAHEKVRKFGFSEKQTKASEMNLAKGRSEAMAIPNGICDICKRPCHINKDHCHRTGRKRGKLCRLCNLGLSFFLDDTWLLKEAARYLEKYIQRFPR